MKYVIIPTVMLFCVISLGQSQDMKRMARDIEVAENILSSLLQEEFESDRAYGVLWGSSNAIEGSYIEDFGVLFTIGSRFRIGGVTMKNDKMYISPGGVDVIVVPKADASPKEEDEAREDAEKSAESIFRRVVEAFILDYAYLLRQLPPDEKIMIRYGGSGNRLLSRGGVIALSGKRAEAAYSAVVKKSDLDAHQEGRIRREQLLERIEFAVSEGGADAEDRDLEILSSVFSTLYKDRPDQKIRMRGVPRYEKIEGLGAIIYLSAGPPQGVSAWALGETTLRYYNLQGQAPLPSEKEDEKDTSEIAAELRSAFPEFMEELKQNVVEYGSIVRNLQEDEALIFRVEFTDCRDCDALPKEVEITAKQPTLAAYKKGTLDLPAAVNQLKVVTKSI